ncbi:MAG TPA: hypothetical protein DHV62_02455, partial [Elusimicrobia bacterium]|nr:hypothetical protein [Elusimicrobiota bacterium]
MLIVSQVNSILWAHSKEAHQYFSAKAVDLCPENIKQELNQYMSKIKQGAYDEDTTDDAYGNLIHDPDT